MPRHEQEEAAPLNARSPVDEPEAEAQAEREQTGSEQAGSEQAGSEQAGSEQAGSGEAGSEQAGSGEAGLEARREAETREDLSRRETLPTPSGRSRALPTAVGRYQVRAELGRGGVGVVYRAWDPHLEREVALKTLIAGRDASEVQIERFLREVRAATQLRHPHLVSVHDAGVEEGCFYLAMDRIEGESLADLLGREGALAPRRAAELLLPIAKALAHAHAEGFLHRDVKPENLLIDTAGECYLTDFGLAVDLSESERLTHTHQSLGTPAFMAPEQLRGHNRDPRVDVYSLGATLYECLTGRVPYDADSFPELLHQVLTTEPPAPARAAAAPRAGPRGDRADLPRARARAALSERGRAGR